MLYRLTIAKRIVAASGIALVALGCVHQTRALCRATGCQPPATANETASCDCCQKPAPCQRDGEFGDRDATVVDVAACCCAGQHSPACPSPDQCVCCRQLPTPAQSSPVDAGSLLAAINCVHCDSAPAIVDAAASGGNAAHSPIVAERSIDRCARLCRLLA